jgi:hypothetical protein
MILTGFSSKALGFCFTRNRECTFAIYAFMAISYALRIGCAGVGLFGFLAVRAVKNPSLGAFAYNGTIFYFGIYPAAGTFRETPLVSGVKVREICV